MHIYNHLDYTRALFKMQHNMRLAMANPGNVPLFLYFLMKEAMRDFEGFVQMALGINISQAGNNVFSAIESEMKSGKIKKVPFIEIFYTFYGLIAMPFLTMPIASHIFGKEQIDELLNEKWRTHVVRHMMLLLEP